MMMEAWYDYLHTMPHFKIFPFIVSILLLALGLYIVVFRHDVGRRLSFNSNILLCLLLSCGYSQNVTTHEQQQYTCAGHWTCQSTGDDSIWMEKTTIRAWRSTAIQITKNISKKETTNTLNLLVSMFPDCDPDYIESRISWHRNTCDVVSLVCDELISRKYPLLEVTM